ncbi:Cytochrome c oxidase assembly protein cox11, mitochondrial [Brettanomyces nanus]|uniref:Cytochrome c oxidase assembly protein cox11, mitochondrial n=1 Tax=Eeniella nana TaxID=13502 RepID=A0A875S7S7_EENNA|nr:Cytochrome c oxidase assembly protein cox11, mitochondrial [Brettanomyces nanus]QPG76963.1 Cytochrome c oxidase assembly protein cox11, mitochondrial [Brettanomyces nanus]
MMFPSSISLLRLAVRGGLECERLSARGLFSRRAFSISSLKREEEIKKETVQNQEKRELPRLSREEYEKFRDEYYYKKNHVNKETAINYSVSLALLFLALSFASVPIYRAICKRTGWGGTPITDKTKFTSDKMVPVDTDKRIRVQFTAETSSMLPWKFIPQQREVYVIPGETALAFYKAKNRSNKDITGMATYSVTPDNVAPYFNKIQCFCFEEQRLNAGEEVDMPLFFFIDPEFATDPSMRNIDDIVLHYTFFRATHDKDEDKILSDAREKMSKANEEASKAAVQQN